MLAIATDKSIPLPDEVDAFAATIWGPRRSRCVLLADMLRNGTPLPTALEATSGLVSRSSITAINLGAEVGQISRVLRDAAVRQSNDLQELTLVRALSHTMVYLWAMLFVLSGIVGFLMYFIMPKYKVILEGFEVEMPAVTVGLIAGFDWAAQYWYLAVPALSLPLFMSIIVTERNVSGWDTLDVPLMGWLSRLETPLMLRSLSRIIAAGLPLPEGLRVLAAHHHRRGIRAKADRMRYFVEQGADCWEQLHRERFLHSAEVGLFQSAQRIGNLSWVLNELADVIDRRLQRRANYAAQLIDPVSVVFMGLIVGYICLGFFMPLIKVIHGLS
jgi:type II secretory pathway component PulF